MSFLFALLLTSQAAEVQVFCTTDGDLQIGPGEVLDCRDSAGRQLPGVVPPNSTLRLTDFHVLCSGTDTDDPFHVAFTTASGVDAYVMTLPWSAGFITVSPKTAISLPAGTSLHARSKNAGRTVTCDVDIIGVLEL